MKNNNKIIEKKLRVVFMGTPDFAVPSLDILCKNGIDIVGVVTSTDKFGGRGGKQLIKSAVKKYALEHGLKILQPTNLKSPAFIEELQSLKADLQIVVAFRMLPEVVWNMPPLGTYNLHGSLLPKYRGAAPINWAIINGDSTTGVTSFKLKHEIDTGDIVLQDSIEIGRDENAGDIHDRLMQLGAEVVLKTVHIIQEEKVEFKKQDNSLVSKAPKLTPENTIIDFNNEAESVHNFIRGLSPYPGAYTYIDHKLTKIFTSKPIPENGKPGKLKVDNKSLIIYCGSGAISVLEIQMAGKRKMPIGEFLNGYRIENEYITDNQE
ncbi:MAG TPA: methionyl-tRNA formyltransferase [Saprospiraceae bacterium]|nr:methionyl-tRNA formyltransferase [Saprospiraceae bacterium]